MFRRNGFPRSKEKEIPTRLTAEHPTVLWEAQVLGVEEKEMVSEIWCAATHSDEL